MLKRLLLLAFLLLAAPALAQQQAVEAALEAAPQGTRFGLLVVDEAGREVVAIAPDQRFIPASNTKLFTTAAAYALLPGIDQPDADGGARVSLEPGRHRYAPDVRLIGRGDARLSSAPDCRANCLAELADAIAVETRTVGDVVGDDTRFPVEPWSPGMSWNNIGSNEATAVSALTLDRNQLAVRVFPGAINQPPRVEAPAYVSVQNQARTNPTGPIELRLEHTANSRNFRLYGSIPADSGEWHARIGIDDPAHYAAWQLERLLRERGVTVRGKVRVLHRPLQLYDDPVWRAAQVPPADPPARAEIPPLAALVPPPLDQDLVTVNKASQNLHAELLLRRFASQQGLGSLADGLAAERALFERIGIPRAGYDLSDGSGMSSYNRLSPRATVALLRWVATQPWGEAWYASLPVAGVDGTLKRRFTGTPLAGNLAAKTGTLNASNALSGRFRASTGRMLTFAFFANDVPDGTSATAAMEAALLVLAAAN